MSIMSIFPRKNPYRVVSDKEKEDLAQERKDNQAKIVGIVQSAKNCLQTEQFKRYKDDYSVAERKIMDDMIDKSYTDPVQDAFYLREQLARLSVLRQLILSVEEDAKRQI
jgi:hypothetical protein